jgi:hypothetical protein
MKTGSKMIGNEMQDREEEFDKERRARQGRRVW